MRATIALTIILFAVAACAASAEDSTQQESSEIKPLLEQDPEVEFSETFGSVSNEKAPQPPPVGVVVAMKATTRRRATKKGNKAAPPAPPPAPATTAKATTKKGNKFYKAPTDFAKNGLEGGLKAVSQDEPGLNHKTTKKEEAALIKSDKESIKKVTAKPTDLAAITCSGSQARLKNPPTLAQKRSKVYRALKKVIANFDRKLGPLCHHVKKNRTKIQALAITFQSRVVASTRGLGSPKGATDRKAMSAINALPTAKQDKKGEETLKKMCQHGPYAGAIKGNRSGAAKHPIFTKLKSGVKLMDRCVKCMCKHGKAACVTKRVCTKGQLAMSELGADVQKRKGFVHAKTGELLEPVGEKHYAAVATVLKAIAKRKAEFHQKYPNPHMHPRGKFGALLEFVSKEDNGEAPPNSNEQANESHDSDSLISHSERRGLVAQGPEFLEEGSNGRRLLGKRKHKSNGRRRRSRKNESAKRSSRGRKNREKIAMFKKSLRRRGYIPGGAVTIAACKALSGKNFVKLGKIGTCNFDCNGHSVAGITPSEFGITCKMLDIFAVDLVFGWKPDIKLTIKLKLCAGDVSTIIGEIQKIPSADTILGRLGLDGGCLLLGIGWVDFTRGFAAMTPSQNGHVTFSFLNIIKSTITSKAFIRYNMDLPRSDPWKFDCERNTYEFNGLEHKVKQCESYVAFAKSTHNGKTAQRSPWCVPGVNHGLLNAAMHKPSEWLGVKTTVDLQIFKAFEWPWEWGFRQVYKKTLMGQSYTTGAVPNCHSVQQSKNRFSHLWTAHGNRWGDKICLTRINARAANCKGSWWQTNCAQACACAHKTNTQSPNAHNHWDRWDDGRCNAWVKFDPMRCTHGNYKANCAKACCQCKNFGCDPANGNSRL